MTKSEQQTRFHDIYDRFQPMVLQLCTGFMKGDQEQAHDLCQEVFINVWRALPRFRGTSAHKTWLYRITVNTCLQFIRHQKRRSEVSLEGLENKITEEETKNDQARSTLYRAIGQLSELDRLMIMLVLDQLSYEDISEILGISEGNLRVKIHRTKTKLKNIIENERQYE